jgi:hypothetical protein
VLEVEICRLCYERDRLLSSVVSSSVNQVGLVVIRLGVNVKGHHHISIRVAMSVSAFTDRCVFSLALSHYRARFLERWQLYV